MEVVVEMFRKLGLRQVLVTRDGYVASFECSIISASVKIVCIVYLFAKTDILVKLYTTYILTYITNLTQYFLFQFPPSGVRGKVFCEYKQTLFVSLHASAKKENDELDFIPSTLKTTVVLHLFTSNGNRLNILG